MEPNINRQDLTDVIQALQASIRQHKNSERERRESIENLEKLSENMIPIPDRVESTAKRMEVLLQNFPHLRDVKVRHHLSGKARIFAILILIAWLLVTLFAVLWYNTRKDNKRMADNDLKYRYLGFVIPDSVYHADTLCLNDPDNFKWMVERLEARKKAIEHAEIEVRNKEKEAEEARKYMRQLRGRNKN